MQNMKSVVGVILALVPVAYCGGLLYYFIDLSGSVREASNIGLGPTVLGLAVVGMLFCGAVVVKIVRILISRRSSASGGANLAGSAQDDDGGFDADAAIARYMARRPAEAASAAAASPSPEAGGSARPAFGRKIR